MDDTRWLSASAVAKKLGVHKRTVYRLLTSEPMFPRPCLMAGLKRWDEAELDEWIIYIKYRARHATTDDSVTKGAKVGQAGTSAPDDKNGTSRRKKHK